MKGTCIRCGKPFRSVDDIHTCTPPRALVLADELERHLGEFETATRAAAELRRQYEEIEKLKRDLRDYMLAANAEAQLVDELQRENRTLVRQNGEWQRKVESLSQWIREQGSQTDTCTYNILREKCAYCRCHRSKT
jgi:FtsZ-binding cell division protein ZapB